MSGSTWPATITVTQTLLLPDVTIASGTAAAPSYGAPLAAAAAPVSIASEEGPPILMEGGGPLLMEG